MTPRRSSFCWATWITGILSADDSCRWAAWAKSQYTYDKRPDENAEQLATWKAEHADLVARRTVELRAAGWIVRLEDQNKVTLRGNATTLAGQPDIIATRQSEAFGPIEVLVSDAKTGQRKGKDIWQVRIYLMALPLMDWFPSTATFRGEVVYTDGQQPVAAPDVTDHARIVAVLKEVGGSEPPARVPSARECRFCNIAACPDRVVAVETAPVETGVF